MDLYCSATLLFFMVFALSFSAAGQQSTYAEKLGYPDDARVLILHVDDVGMSHDSNEGAIRAVEQGTANSLSIMMPCAWVPEFAEYYKKHPDLDAGLHLTLTSEWSSYRWKPVSGAACTPSLVDQQGAFYPSVEKVVENATLGDVEKEIRAQVQLAKNMGFNPTHLDTHMGTMFATPELVELYVKLGIEYQIPIMFPAGHNTLLRESMDTPPADYEKMKQVGQKLWAAGLPVLDDLHNFSYGWEIPSDAANSDEELRDYWTKKYIDSFEKLEPGVTMAIMHCTDPSDNFASISDSGTLRKADMLAMTNPRLAEYIEEEGIILTTWKELKKRRDQLSATN